MNIPVARSAIIALAFGLQGCDSSSKQEAASTDLASGVDFVEDVRPILERHCIRCHNDESLLGGLNLMNHAAAMRGSNSGPVLVPGDPDKSLLYGATNLEHGKNAKAMPATGPLLTPEEKEIVRRWIEDGAEWPEGEEGSMRPVKAEVPAG